jgi:hypothetical protein
MLPTRLASLGTTLQAPIQSPHLRELTKPISILFDLAEACRGQKEPRARPSTLCSRSQSSRQALDTLSSPSADDYQTLGHLQLAYTGGLVGLRALPADLFHVHLTWRMSSVPQKHPSTLSADRSDSTSNRYSQRQ